MAKRYLNNKDLMVEIHKSKATYCTFLDKAYEDYDVIVRDVSEVVEDGVRYRVMSSDHIPDALTKAQASKSPALKGKVKLIFAPFSHYILKDGQPLEVGRSHWFNGLANGHFRQDHGRMTPKLGRMFVMLVKEYGKKPNWRSYSYLDEMQASALVNLSAEGLKFDESRGSNPFAYFTQVVTNAFIKVQNAERKVADLRDDLRMDAGQMASTRAVMAWESRSRPETPAVPSLPSAGS